MNLREAKKKRVGPHIKAQQPFPIWLKSESEYSVDRELWPTFIGTFAGDCVVLSNPDEMKTVYTMAEEGLGREALDSTLRVKLETTAALMVGVTVKGFFGKGSYSRGYPSFSLTKKGIPPIIKDRQWKRRKAWMEKIKTDLTTSLNCKNSGEMNDPKDKLKDNKSEQTTNDPSVMEVESDPLLDPKAYFTSNGLIQSTSEFDTTEVLVLADSDNEDLDKVIRDPQPHLAQVPINIASETLNLTLEEAFFLSYGFGCLQITDLFGNPLDLKEQWVSFSKIRPDFVESYVVYHYFRAKGWVVKSGFKFGGNFLLYKQGPPFYHASYIVLVEKVDPQLKRYEESLNWTKLHGLNRLAENSGKDIIVCQVVCPDKLSSEDLQSPHSLARYQVGETLVKRWISSQERVEKE